MVLLPSLRRLGQKERAQTRVKAAAVRRGLAGSRDGSKGGRDLETGRLGLPLPRESQRKRDDDGQLLQLQTTRDAHTETERDTETPESE